MSLKDRLLDKISRMMPTIIVIWHHIINFCSISLIVGAIVGFFQDSMPLAQILVYLIMGGLNLTMSYYKGYLRF